MSAHRKKHPFDFKTQYGVGFNQQDDEIGVDFFCGGSGAGGDGGKSSVVSLRLLPEHEEGALRAAAFLINYYGTENVSSGGRACTNEDHERPAGAGLRHGKGHALYDHGHLPADAQAIRGVQGPGLPRRLCHHPQCRRQAIC